ncbi:MAG: AMP-binding protein [Myxococcota bacterium]|jgi:long-chain acyl-CoA synthetase
MYEQKPWLKFYGDVPRKIDYPQVTLYEALMRTVDRSPDKIAWEFMGYKCTYRQFAWEIDRFSSALSVLGLKKGDRFTISMPTSPQGIICFYAVVKLGGVASMIHPLSPPKEIEFYLNLSKSRFALTIDAFYGSFRDVMDKTPCKKLILAEIPDFLPPLKALGFRLTKGRKIPKVPKDPRVVWWRDMVKKDNPPVPPAPGKTDDLAVIMYSGGTTGTPKGIMLSHRNFISEGLMVAHWGGMDDRDKILAILPIFHGFGLGVCLNATFMGGGQSILVPMFTPESVADLIKKKRPSFVVGVPTLFDALNRNEQFNKTDLSSLKGCFSGADTLPRPVKEEFERIVKRQGGNVKLLEGYGLTEAVTAIMAMPIKEYREGSVGVPFPEMSAKVVRVGTTDEMPVGEEGEICLSGPAVMLGYLDQPDETANVLKVHADGLTWLHTGDIASMDADGFFYFKLRLKRMIKSSGINVYPVQVEEILRRHPEVDTACVIGLPDKAQVQRVKAFVVLKDISKASPAMEKSLIAYCQENLLKWSCPREIEFRADLPKTLIGKIAFNTLEQEELAKLKAEGKFTG